MVPDRLNIFCRPETDPFFLNWEYYSLLKSCKMSRFWPKSTKIWLKFLERNWKYFSKIFLQKTSDFFGDFCVFRGHFYHQKENKIFKKKLSRSTDPTWKVCPPVKQGFFLSFFSFFFFSWPYHKLQATRQQITLFTIWQSWCSVVCWIKHATQQTKYDVHFKMVYLIFSWCTIFRSIKIAYP